MIKLLLLLVSFVTPRSYVMFETPFNSYLSNSSMLVYPSLLEDETPEFFVNPYKEDAYFVYSKSIKDLNAGGMIYTSGNKLAVLSSLGTGKNSVGVGMNYMKERGINGGVFSFSHTTGNFEYDIGVLIENKYIYNLYSSYFRIVKKIGDQTALVSGFRYIKGRNNGIGGFLNLVFSPVSGQYVEGILGYSPLIGDFYMSLGMSHQFYKNIGLNLGFGYPFSILNNERLNEYSYFESYGVLPYYSDVRFGFVLRDNNSIYRLDISQNSFVLREFFSTGRLLLSPYNFNISVSVYFYSF